MTHVTRSALVMHTAQRMYSLVVDVARYPDFLPWCRAAEVQQQTDSVQTASISMSMPGVEQRFTTRNELEPERLIRMTLVEGPFSRLQGKWQFTPLGGIGCKIELDVSFAFNNSLVAATTRPAFSTICTSLVEAFCQRADDIFPGHQ